MFRMKENNPRQNRSGGSSRPRSGRGRSSSRCHCWTLVGVCLLLAIVVAGLVLGYDNRKKFLTAEAALQERVHELQQSVRTMRP